MSVFLRLTSVVDKSRGLANEIAGHNAGDLSLLTFAVEAETFDSVPGAPFAYWLPERVRNVFRELPDLTQSGGSVRQGLATTDDFRFVRAWWEPSARPSWMPFHKGGRRAPFFRDVTAVLHWDSAGAELKALITDRYGSPSKRIYNENFYGCPGYSWPLRGVKFSAYAGARGCVFGIAGKMAFVEEQHLLPYLALFNSNAFDALIMASAGKVGGVQYEVGLIGRVPVPSIEPVSADRLSLAAGRAWSLKRSLDTITETSHAFLLPALLQVDGATVADRAAAWSAHVAEVEAELGAIQREIDDIAFFLYGIEGEDRARIEAEAGTAPAAAPSDDAEPGEEPEAAEDDGDEEDDDSSAADAATLATELLSWAIGVAFGRFDMDYAGGLREPPPEPGPFDPLPARSPGMSPDDSRAVEVLVDEEGHPEDLVQRIANIFGHAFGPWHDERLEEAVQLAGASDLRTWLRRSFFPFHLKRYSKSRRKAPIWWPLTTASGSYTLWVAWPRLTRDTPFRLTSEQEPYIAAKVAQETRKLTSLKQDAGKAPTNAQAKAIGAQEEFVAELTALRDELAMIAPMWNPIHDDGVVLHAALLWRVTRDAGWQKECREKWEGLAAGKYDWAHIAMHLWPERVVPKCREDRSLAIAHGLEERFWVEIAGKWRLRDGTDQAMNEEIAARSSAAVKKALRAFTEAPAPARGRRGKKGA